MKKIMSLIFMLFISVLSLTSCGFNLPFNNYTYKNAEKYVAGSGSLQGVKSIDIDWISGSVNFIVVYDVAEDTGLPSYGSFYEKYDDDLTDEQILHYYNNNGNLSIKYCKSGTNSGNIHSKDLYIALMGEEVFKNIDINVISADVKINYLTCDDLDIEAVSGNVNIQNIKANSADINTVSGDVKVGNPSDVRIDKYQKDEIESIEVECVSGSITLQNLIFKEANLDSVSGDAKVDFYDSFDCTMDIDTVSGDVKLAFLYTTSMTIEFETTSGTFESSIPNAIVGGKYIYNDGENLFKIDTTSGDLTVDRILLLN